MKAERFLDFATQLASGAPTATISIGPAECRTAISRAYYSVYHFLSRFIEQELAISIKGTGARENSHLLLQQYLLNSNVAEAMEMGRMLQDLHESRKEADYDLDDLKVETLLHAQVCLSRANRLLAKVELVRKSPLKQQLIAGLTQYRRLRQGVS